MRRSLALIAPAAVPTALVLGVSLTAVVGQSLGLAPVVGQAGLSGDAYRAGLLYGVAQGMDWRATGQLASLMGALKIGSRGGQNHRATRAEIEALYSKHFGATLS